MQTFFLPAWVEACDANVKAGAVPTIKCEDLRPRYLVRVQEANAKVHILCQSVAELLCSAYLINLLAVYCRNRNW